MTRFSWIAVILWVVAVPVDAHFAIDKTRLYFDKSNRYQVLTIRNNAESAVVYSVKVNHVNMTEQGQLLAVADESKVKLSAEKLVRYSPRRGTILPGGSQVVRFTVKKPVDLASGEYRSQLRIEGGLQDDPTQMAAKLAYNLPIIVRHGKTKAEASMHSFAVSNNAKDQSELTLMLTRTGNRSTFGAFSVLDPAGVEIGRTKGVSVYEPLRQRIVTIPLDQTPQGTLTINYRELAEYGGDIKLSQEFLVR